jgi:hypothetical protein
MTTPQGQWLTLFFIAAMTALVIGYDLLIIRAVGPDASISRVMGRLLEPGLLFPALAFWVGLILGHLWLPSR